MVSGEHANFIINVGDAKGNEVLELINIIQKRIYYKFGIQLVLEIQIW